MYRFDVDYLDEERGIKNIPCDDGDYVLAEDALKLQAKIDAGRLVMKAQRETIDQLKIKCEAYRNEPESELQAKIDTHDAIWSGTMYSIDAAQLKGEDDE